MHVLQCDRNYGITCICRLSSFLYSLNFTFTTYMATYVTFYKLFSLKYANMTLACLYDGM